MQVIFKRIGESVFKLALLALVGLFIYVQVSDGDKWESTQAAFLGGLSDQRLAWLIVAALLLSLNLWIESYKWKFLVGRFHPISLVKSLESVLAGLAAGLITPGRIGDVGGRALVLRQQMNWNALFPGVLNSLAQNLAILIFGCLSLGYFLSAENVLSQGGLFLLAVGGLLALGILFLLFFHMEDILKALAHLDMPVSWRKRLLQWAQTFEAYSNGMLLRALGFSALRLLVFSLQFYCLLIFFQGYVPFAPALASILLVYLIQVGIPIPPVLDVFARGGIALFFFKNLGINELATLSATFTLWLLNVIVPAVAGYFILFKVKYQKTAANASVTE